MSGRNVKSHGARQCRTTATPAEDHLPKRDTRQSTRSTEEEEEFHTWPREALTREGTPCDSSSHDSCTYGSDPVNSMDMGTVIEMDCPNADSPWDSTVDGQDGEDSDTSTPDYKRGKHSRGPSLTDGKVVELIKKEGLEFKLPRWLQERRTQASILILADSQLKYWPPRNNICQVEFHPNWPINRWTQALRAGIIQVECGTVIIYLEGTRRWEDVPPIKNILQTLYKNIRNLGNNPRIFIANHLPGVNVSPLCSPLMGSNFILQQATRSIGRAIGKVFELSLFEHFVSSNGRIIQPVDDYFVENGTLTKFGCMVFRECIMRESGVKSYWFAKKEQE